MAVQQAEEHAPVVPATRARSGRWGKTLLWMFLIAFALSAVALFVAWGMRAGQLHAVEGNQTATTAAEAAQGDTEPSPARQTGNDAPPPNAR